MIFCNITELPLEKQQAGTTLCYSKERGGMMWKETETNGHFLSYLALSCVSLYRYALDVCFPSLLVHHMLRGHVQGLRMFLELDEVKLPGRIRWSDA